MMLPHISNANSSATAFTKVSLAALITSCFSLSASAQTATNKSAVQDGTGRTYAIAVPNYAGLTDKQSDQMTDSIEKQQEALKADLVAQLTQNNLSVEAKEELIRLVGELKAYKAIDILIKNVDFFHDRSYINGISVSPTAMQIDGGYVARTALVEFGDTSFDATKIRAYCWVLYSIRGTASSTQQLKKQLAKEKDPKVQAQYRSVLARMKAFPAD